VRYRLAALEHLGFEYAVVVSFASTAYVEPRFACDVAADR